MFEFDNPPGERSINTIKDQVIRAKEKHVNLLKQWIAMVRTEDQLKVKKTQDAIEKFKNKIIGEFCSLVRTEDQFKVKKTQDAIEKFKNKIIGEVCSNIPCNTQVFFRGNLGNY